MENAVSTGAEAGNALASVTSAITGAIGDLTPQATAVIAAAVGLGIIFWGAKLLWTKFKSMAK